MAYSTLHPLGDGTWGLLYESGGYKNIEFMRLDADYLGLTDPGEEDAPEPEPMPDPQPQPAPEPNPTATPAHWVNTGSGWKWQLEDSSYAMNQTIVIGEATYRFGADGASGAMLTGWQHAGSWYYLAPSGAMLTGWQQLGSAWYYFAGDGHMVTGWQMIDGRWYFFAPSGAWI